jgi:hypothetical protein
MTEFPKKKRQTRSRSTKLKRDPLELLVTSLLTLDWEISDENIDMFEKELRTVRKQFTGDRYSKRLIDTTLPVCNYLRVRKESASPASMQFLHSATRALLQFWRKTLNPGERSVILKRLRTKFRSLMADVQKLEGSAAAAAKEGLGRGAKKPRAATEVLKVIKGSRKGVDVATLKQTTGLTDGQIRGIIYRACKKGEIKRISRGVYVSA